VGFVAIAAAVKMQHIAAAIVGVFYKGE